MEYDPDRHHRRSIRLPGYDYSQAGAYFVTICTQERECLFGEVVNGEVRLNAVGCVVQSVWDGLPERFPNVVLDAFVVMPNHVHGVIMIVANTALVGARLALPNHRHSPPDKENIPYDGSPKQNTPRNAPPLGDIVGAFKSISAVACNRLLGRAGIPFWQRNYYEHVVRDEAELNKIRQYIADNPAQWAIDHDNPATWDNPP